MFFAIWRFVENIQVFTQKSSKSAETICKPITRKKLLAQSWPGWIFFFDLSLNPTQPTDWQTQPNPTHKMTIIMTHDPIQPTYLSSSVTSESNTNMYKVYTSNFQFHYIQ